MSPKKFFKINGNYLSFACLSNKISFLSYSIFNLLFPELKLGAPLSRCELVYITTSHILLSSVFQNFFKVFSKNFFFRSYFTRPTLSSGQLVYITTSYFLLSTLFCSFFRLFLSFFPRIIRFVSFPAPPFPALPFLIYIYSLSFTLFSLDLTSGFMLK